MGLRSVGAGPVGVNRVQFEAGPHRLRPCLTRRGQDGTLRKALTPGGEVLVEAHGSWSVVIEGRLREARGQYPQTWPSLRISLAPKNTPRSASNRIAW